MSYCCAFQGIFQIYTTPCHIKTPTQSFTKIQHISPAVYIIFKCLYRHIPEIFPLLLQVSTTTYSTWCHGTIDWQLPTYSAPIPHKEMAPQFPNLWHPNKPPTTLWPQPIPGSPFYIALVQNNQYHILSGRMDAVCSNSFSTPKGWWVVCLDAKGWGIVGPFLCVE